jgi:hypothetical protein
LQQFSGVYRRKRFCGVEALQREPSLVPGLVDTVHPSLTLRVPQRAMLVLYRKLMTSCLQGIELALD